MNRTGPLDARSPVRILPAGDTAVLVELPDLEAVSGTVQALITLRAQGELSHVTDVIPAARTVLVRFTTDGDPMALTDAVRTAVSAPTPPVEVDPQHTVQIPVTYDGPDLPDVAAATGLSVAHVIEAHTATVWRCAFIGFSPGFSYLTGGDRRLRVPRRSQPRTTVPAGSVGLAGEFSGIYPAASPGGWQLIGRTETVMWDLDRSDPALAPPGTWVRFVPAGVDP